MFSSRLTFCNAVSAASEGIDPVSEFVATLSVCSDVSALSDAGRLPLRLFWGR